MKTFLFAATLWCLSTLSSALIAERAAPFCSRPGIVIITKLLNLPDVRQPASRFCASFLGVATPIPSQYTVTSQTTTTSTTTSTDVLTSTTTATDTVTQTATILVTSSIAGSTTTTTVTSTSYSAPPVVQKRAFVEERAVPPTPKALKGVAKTVASQACSCFLGLPRPTTTVVSTSTASTVVVDTSTDVVPTTITLSETVSTTETTTTTGPASTATTTSVVSVRYTYNRLNIPNRGCTYNRYYDFPSASNNPGPNGDYKDAINACQNICTNTPRCRFFLYLRFDPAEARGFDGAACIFDDQPYDPSLLQCQYPTQIVRAYNRIS
ncbi:MAG: hypothetical protein M1825_003072 [Sarcosagium campestre]|nr:MAG: hypothetical protein M1825_003072 [Sarcosagium campestre]